MSKKRPSVVRAYAPDEDAQKAALKLLIEGKSGGRTKPVERRPTSNS